ncbi:hypothetical protein PROP_02611 [Propionicimonas sp. T2.31MG-18]|uniref:hypothetical protein n=1 Tax=Propionicimonas sp. T2.31MG-18 TaxID=3157620 RepID=UPI0035ED85A7
MDFPVRLGWWPVLHLVVALSAISQGAILVGVWAANLTLAGDPAAGEAIVAAMVALGWVEIGLSAVIVIGLAVGAWLHRPLWARGVASVIIGMVLHWGWWLLDRRVDVFGTADLTVPDIEARLQLRLWTMLGIDVVSVVALVLGGILLVRHRPRSRGESDELDEEWAVEDADEAGARRA